MAKKKSKKPSWIDIKKSIKKLDSSQLIDLLKDLYQLSEENKSFLLARCLIGSDSLGRYKKVILDSLYPDVMDEHDNFEFDRADKAINAYAKATSDDEGIADLMIYYVECGNKFTLDYGDIDEFFYDALIQMYEKAVKIVFKMPKKKQETFRKRLKTIMMSANGIGWGYYDDLCHYYSEAFE
jgi:hypothetical protein